LAAAATLTLANPTPPTTLLRTKVLRFMVSLDNGMMDRRHFYSEGAGKVKWIEEASDQNLVHFDTRKEREC
jgi:hypothetical protein